MDMSISVSEKEQGLLNWLKGQAQPVTTQEISRALGLNEETVRSLLESLRGKQLIIRAISSTSPAPPLRGTGAGAITIPPPNGLQDWLINEGMGL